MYYEYCSYRKKNLAFKEWLYNFQSIFSHLFEVKGIFLLFNLFPLPTGVWATLFRNNNEGEGDSGEIKLVSLELDESVVELSSLWFGEPGMLISGEDEKIGEPSDNSESFSFALKSEDESDSLNELDLFKLHSGEVWMDVDSLDALSLNLLVGMNGAPI